MSKLVLCYKAVDAQEATLIELTLESHGIAAKTTGIGVLIGYGDIFSGTHAVEIWVPEEHLEAAQRLIKGHLKKSARTGSDYSLAEWTCSKCGKANEGTFAICWNCQAPR